MRKNKLVDKRSLTELSKSEFGELLLTVMIGLSVRSSIAESHDADWQRIDDQLIPLLNYAENQGFSDLIQDFQGTKLPIDVLEKEEERILEEFNEEEFWETLEVRLGQRDFFASLSDKEKKGLASDIWLPDKIHRYYDKYRKEFEKYGIERLRIVQNKPKSSK